MNGSSVKYPLILGCLLLAMYGSFVLWRHQQQSALIAEASAGKARPTDRITGAETKSAEPPLEEFALIDQDGQPFDSKSLKGKVWVGSFFFTNCPAVCWRLNQNLAAIQQTTPASDVRYVSITCDPDNDTPIALKKYAEHFKADPARWSFLTGDMQLIRRIGNDMFKVSVETGTHSDRAFIVDRAGQVRGRFRTTEPDQLQMLKKQLAQVEAEDATPAPAAPAEPQATPQQPQAAPDSQPDSDTSAK
jgi:cytochrome oxidase Cu insertion factor (SCO1/SenC/PrrC family)